VPLEVRQGVEVEVDGRPGVYVLIVVSNGMCNLVYRLIIFLNSIDFRDRITLTNTLLSFARVQRHLISPSCKRTCSLWTWPICQRTNAVRNVSSPLPIGDKGLGIRTRDSQ